MFLRVPAKLNFSLRIVGRRPDGYHLLDSLMVPVDICDTLRVSLDTLVPRARESVIRVTSDSPTLPHGPDNLAFKAAALLLEALQTRAEVAIHIRKRIPLGSGLGGASSNAAGVLLALNRMLGHPLPPGKLAHIGLRIGADVPFFVVGHPARVRGVGDRISPIQLARNHNVVVCSDAYNLSTALVYGRVARSLTTQRPLSNIAAFVAGRAPLSSVLVNDLEAAAAQIHPEVLSLKTKLLEEGALGALMTGSGSAVFGIWSSRVAAVGATRRLRQQGLWARATQTLEVSPAVCA